MVWVFVLVEETDAEVSTKDEYLGAMLEEFAERFVVCEANIDMSLD